MPVVFLQSTINNQDKNILAQVPLEPLDKTFQGDNSECPKEKSNDSYYLPTNFGDALCERCGLEVPLNRLRRHHSGIENSCKCLDTVVHCRNHGCKLSVRLEDRDWHEQVDCLRRKHRNRLIKQLKKKRDEENEGCTCRACGEKLSGQRLADHLSTECRLRKVVCNGITNLGDGCGQTMTAEQLVQHISLRKCKTLRHRDDLVEKNVKALTESYPCSICGDKTTTLRTISKHKLELCPSRIVPCGNLGCKNDNITAARLKNHMENECKVTLERNKMAERTKERTRVRACTQRCGELVKDMRSHCKKDCPRRFVLCICGATYRFCDHLRHKKQDLYYTIHMVPVCPLAVKREQMAEKAKQRRDTKQAQTCLNSPLVHPRRMVPVATETGTGSERYSISKHLLRNHWN